MKKKFLLLFVILLAGVCFSSLENNSLKACCKNAAAGCSRKRSDQKIRLNETGDADASFNMFMNPFQQL
jgi:hypothetical protein